MSKRSVLAYRMGGVAIGKYKVDIGQPRPKVVVLHSPGDTTTPGAVPKQPTQRHLAGIYGPKPAVHSCNVGR